jgi:hypothetical protein
MEHSAARTTAAGRQGRRSGGPLTSGIGGHGRGGRRACGRGGGFYPGAYRTAGHGRTRRDPRHGGPGVLSSADTPGGHTRTSPATQPSHPSPGATFSRSQPGAGARPRPAPSLPPSLPAHSSARSACSPACATGGLPRAARCLCTRRPPPRPRQPPPPVGPPASAAPCSGPAPAWLAGADKRGWGSESAIWDGYPPRSSATGTQPDRVRWATSGPHHASPCELSWCRTPAGSPPIGYRPCRRPCRTARSRLRARPVGGGSTGSPVHPRRRSHSRAGRRSSQTTAKLIQSG